MHRSHSALVARHVQDEQEHGRWVRFPHGWLEKLGSDPVQFFLLGEEGKNLYSALLRRRES